MSTRAASTHGSLAISEWRANWTVVPPSLLGVALCAVHMYTIGVMVAPLEQEFGWSRASITAGPFIIALIGLWAAPLAGSAVDRFGPRPIGLTGIFLFSIALALLGTTSSNVVIWWLLWALIGMVSMLIQPTIWTAAVISRFTRNRGMALAIILTGTGLTAAVIPLLTDYLIIRLGWRMAFAALGAIMFLVVFPPVFLLFRDSHDLKKTETTDRQAYQMDKTALRQAVLSATFLRLFGGVFVFAFALCALTINAVPVLTGLGFPGLQAAAIAGLVGIGSICGRFGAGFLLDRINARFVAAGSVVAPIIASVLLLAIPGSAMAAQLAFLLIGLAAGAEYDAAAYLASRHFGMRGFGTLFGLISGGLLLANGLAPLIANAIYDMVQSYNIVLWAQLPLGLLASVLFLALGKYPDNMDETH